MAMYWEPGTGGGRFERSTNSTSKRFVNLWSVPNLPSTMYVWETSNVTLLSPSRESLLFGEDCVNSIDSRPASGRSGTLNFLSAHIRYDRGSVQSSLSLPEKEVLTMVERRLRGASIVVDARTLSTEGDRTGDASRFPIRWGRDDSDPLFIDRTDVSWE